MPNTGNKRAVPGLVPFETHSMEENLLLHRQLNQKMLSNHRRLVPQGQEVVAPCCHSALWFMLPGLGFCCIFHIEKGCITSQFSNYLKHAQARQVLNLNSPNKGIQHYARNLLYVEMSPNTMLCTTIARGARECTVQQAQNINTRATHVVH